MKTKDAKLLVAQNAQAELIRKQRELDNRKLALERELIAVKAHCLGAISSQLVCCREPGERIVP